MAAVLLLVFVLFAACMCYSRVLVTVDHRASHTRKAWVIERLRDLTDLSRIMRHDWWFYYDYDIRRDYEII